MGTKSPIISPRYLVKHKAADILITPCFKFSVDINVGLLRISIGP